MGLAGGLATNGQSGGGGGGGGAVSSVFGRTGTVVAASGDYTPAQAGALPAGTTGPGGSAGANLGAAPTIPAASSYNVFWGVANVNTTITLPTPTVGQDFTLVVDEPAGGGSTIALSGSVNWPNGTMTWQTGASVRNAVEFFCVNGTQWDAYPLTGPTLAPLASPTFTGTPAAPTPAVDDNTTKLSTTAFVLGQTSTANPSMNGTAAAGTSTRFARADHVHPTDTSRAISSLWRPAGTKTETIDRGRVSSNGLSAMVSGRLYLVGGCQLPAGTAVNTVTFYSGTTGAGPYEVDSIAATGATSGTFQVSFTWNGNVYTTVTAINWNDTAATIQADLLAAQRTGAIAFSADAGASGLVCSGGPLNTAAVTVTFQNNANGPVTAQTVSSSTIAGATATFTRTTSGVLPSNQWACLVDQSGNVLAKSADATTSAWGANTAKAFTLSATYTPSADIGVYAGLVVVASTVPNLQGTSTLATAGLAPSVAPMTAAVANTGLTNPASLGATIGAQTYSSNLGYATIG